jgi:acetylornithine deacetylase/succinyl-diaminopimelate desuccinylase-like protein
MKLDRLIANTLAIQAIPSPTFHESRRAAFMQETLAGAGLREIEIDTTGNVYGVIRGGPGLPVVLSAHLDTVFEAQANVEARLEGERLVGPGVGDNAIALASLIELCLDLPALDRPGDVWLVADVCEEGLGNLQGMQQVVARFGPSVAAYICLEGMALGYIYHRALPVHRYRVTATTVGGHAWIHAGRPSAIHTLLRIGSGLLGLAEKAIPRTTLNVGTIAGGTTINTIARSACMEIDLRSESTESLRVLRDQVAAIAMSYADRDVHVQVETIGERPGGELPQDHDLVMAARRALEDAGERRVSLEVGSTDASIPLSLGLPGICVGLTRGGEAHSLKEFIELQPVTRGYQSVLNLILAALQMGRAVDSLRSSA